MIAAMTRRRREIRDSLLRACGAPRQAHALASEIVPSPFTAVLHAVLPPRIVVRRAAGRIQRSGFEARTAAALAGCIHRHEHFGSVAHLTGSGNLSEPLAHALADEIHPVGLAALANATFPPAWRRRLSARRLHRAGHPRAQARIIGQALHPPADIGWLHLLCMLPAVPPLILLVALVWMDAAAP